jgi:peptidoglycan/LPS O-acetylase OafA/YrhL
MPVTDLPAVRTPPTAAGLLPGPPPRGYLESFNLFRVIACLAVVGQHSFIWTNMTGNVVGTAFITMLHLSRNSFFFLAGMVTCYAQITHPRSLGGFWKRRYVQLGVPYLVWTGIYLVFSLVTVSASWAEVGIFLRQNLLLGFSQMYAVIVIFQFYLVFPLLLRWFRASRHHGRIMIGSLAFATLVGLFLHYPSWFPSPMRVGGTVNTYLPWGRDFFVYQEFFIAGMLVALHLDQVLDFVSRHYRKILTFTVVTGAFTVYWYMFSVWSGNSVERASDIYEPFATLWCFAAIAGILCLSWLWERRSQASARTPRRTFPSAAYFAGLTGGIFFAHTLFLDMFRAALTWLGWRAEFPWEATVAVLFVSGIVAAGCLAALEVRSPLRWVLGGPVRSEQRARYSAHPGPSLYADVEAPTSWTSHSLPSGSLKEKKDS